MRLRAFQSPALTGVALGAVLAVGGCSGMAGSGNLVPDGATVEKNIPSNDTWVSFANAEALGNERARSDIQRRWASPNYGTSGWKNVVVSDNKTGDAASFPGSQWMWYPMDGFEFGANNSMPDNRKFVHFRREFYNDRLPSEVSNSSVTVMTSGNISYEVFINGFSVQIRGG
ncbi:MAG: hypothetical protein O3A46_15180, partial [Candidatus Poribacteria bacterium]|nr:hypothetical protein [Candidatus Poribacteria bacterium]